MIVNCFEEPEIYLFIYVCVCVHVFFLLLLLLSSLFLSSFSFNCISNKIFWIRKQTCTFIGSWAFNFEFQVVNEFSIMKFQLVWHTVHYYIYVCVFNGSDKIFSMQGLYMHGISLRVRCRSMRYVTIHFVNLNWYEIFQWFEMFFLFIRWNSVSYETKKPTNIALGNGGITIDI